jgi:hypothetical protein
LNGLICSGPLKNKKQSYGLLDERVPYKKDFTRDESLAELAKRYFTSHGPATIADFAWWSGLSLKDARQALEFVKSGLLSETIDSKEYWFAAIVADTKQRHINIHLLPAYDEFLISYKDRSASLTLTINKNVISSNGIFRPVILIDGQVSGIWKCSRKNESIIIDIQYFQKNDKLVKNLTEKVAKRFGAFFGKEAKICLNNGNDTY